MSRGILPLIRLPITTIMLQPANQGLPGHPVPQAELFAAAKDGPFPFSVLHFKGYFLQKPSCLHPPEMTWAGGASFLAPSWNSGSAPARRRVRQQKTTSKPGLQKRCVHVSVLTGTGVCVLQASSTAAAATF